MKYKVTKFTSKKLNPTLEFPKLESGIMAIEGMNMTSESHCGYTATE